MRLDTSLSSCYYGLIWKPVLTPYHPQFADFVPNGDEILGENLEKTLDGEAVDIVLTGIWKNQAAIIVS